MAHNYFLGGKQQLGRDFLLMPKTNPYVQVASKGSNHVNTLLKLSKVAR